MSLRIRTDHPHARRGAALAACLAVAASCCPAQRAGAERLALLPPVIGTTELYASTGRSGFGLSGYDPVSYFLDPAPRPGLPDNEVLRGGLVWRFAGPANEAAFRRDPDAFLPRIGGYDAAAAADGRVIRADRSIFAVQGGRLYLFRSAEARRRFLGQPQAAAMAEARWRDLMKDLVRT